MNLWKGNKMIFKKKEKKKKDKDSLSLKQIFRYNLQALKMIGRASPWYIPYRMAVPYKRKQYPRNISPALHDQYRKLLLGLCRRKDPDS